MKTLKVKVCPKFLLGPKIHEIENNQKKKPSNRCFRESQNASQKNNDAATTQNVAAKFELDGKWRKSEEKTEEGKENYREQWRESSNQVSSINNPMFYSIQMHHNISLYSRKSEIEPTRK